MNLCWEKIAELYGKTLDKKTLKDVFDTVQDLHDSGKTRGEIANAIKGIASHIDVDRFFELSAMRDSEVMVPKLRNLITKTTPNDLDNGINDMLFRSVRFNEATGYPVEVLQKVNINRLVKPLDMAIKSRDGGKLYLQMEKFGLDQWKMIAETIVGNGPKDLDPGMKFLADMFKHQNQVLFKEKVRFSVKDFIDKDYIHKVQYDGGAIRKAGIKQFSLDALENITFKNPSYTTSMSDFNSVSAIRELLKNPATTEASLRALVNSKEPTQYNKQLLKALVEVYTNWSTSTDPYREGILLSESKAGIDSAAQTGLWKERMIKFNSPSHQMDFLEKYGKFGSNIYRYIKSDSYSLANAVAFKERFGINSGENFSSLLNELGAYAQSNGLAFNRDKAIAKYNYTMGLYTRVPEELKLDLLHPSENLADNIAWSVEQLKTLSSSATLAGSALTQITLDPANIYANLIMRSNENLFSSTANFIKYGFESLGDLTARDRELAIEIVDLAYRHLGEEHLKEKNLLHKLGDIVSYPASQVNKWSQTFGYKVTNHMLKTGRLENLPEILNKYGINEKEFSLVSGLMADGFTPYELPELSNAIFSDLKPSNVSMYNYKRKLANMAAAFTEETRRGVNLELSTKTKYYINIIGNDETTLYSTLLKMVTQFKGMPMEALNTSRQISNMRGGGFYQTSKTLAQYSAALVSAGASLMILRKLLKNNFNIEETKKELFTPTLKNPAPWNALLLDSVFRYGILSPFTEYMSNARTPSEVALGAIETPATKATRVVISPSIAAVKKMKGDRNYITGVNAKEFVQGVQSLIPGSTLMYMTQWADEYVKLQKETAKKIDRIDGIRRLY